MNANEAKKLLKKKIQEENKDLAVTVTIIESGKTQTPTGHKGFYAKGQAFSVNKKTGNSEKANFTFEHYPTLSANWNARMRKA